MHSLKHLKSESGNQHESALDSQPQHNKKWIKGLYEWCEAGIISLICIILVFLFVFRIVGVRGDSMNPTLYENERLILRTLFYKPQRGDIIVIDRYTQDPLIKRVIAVGGDKLSIIPETGEIVLNNVVLQEDYIPWGTPINDFGTDTKEVPKGYLIVMGDNRPVSKDSRSAEIGFVNEKDVIGKTICRFYPLDRFRIFD